MGDDGRDFAAELRAIYTEHCPGKLKSVDKVLKTHSGREAALIDKMRAKYEGNGGENGGNGGDDGGNGGDDGGNGGDDGGDDPVSSGDMKAVSERVASYEENLDTPQPPPPAAAKEEEEPPPAPPVTPGKKANAGKETLLSPEERLKRNADDAESWHSLGDKGGGFVNGSKCTVQTCYEEALRVDPHDPKGWVSLATSTPGGGTVDGKLYSAEQCFREALKLNPQDPQTWNALGKASGGTVDGEPYTAEECYDKALEIDPECEHAWFNKIQLKRQLKRASQRS